MGPPVHRKTDTVSCFKMEDKKGKSRKRQPKTIIIGGGIAGLAAGKYLQLEGVNDFTILEASDRIGGRIWSVPVGKCNKKSKFTYINLDMVLSLCH